ncbi:methyltransferase [Streptosporangium sp. NPDC002721]|uniref:methyltransferase n=1 Tax=Streptosporangium sp. NPDC002721 TaxID=3366188 RepID=UPI0036A13CDF
MTEHELMRILTGGWVAEATFAAVRLGVADTIAGHRLSPGEIAEKVGAHPEALGRLLRLLAGVGLADVDEDGRYGLTPMGALLGRDRLGPLVELYGEDYFGAAWRGLPHTLRTGETAFEHVFGEPVFAHLKGDPGKASVFNAGMAAGAAFFREVPVAHDFSGARTVVDLAGGTGALLGTVLRDHPEAGGILFDVPGVVANAPAHLDRMGVLERCELVGGDLFESVPEGGDVYLLSRILHDWDDDRCVRLLRNCARAMGKGAELLVIERVVSADTHLPLAFDLHMMVMTGGRERTEEEYRALLESAELLPGELVDLPLGMRMLTATR